MKNTSSSKPIQQLSKSQLFFKGEVAVLPVRRCRGASVAQKNITVCIILFFFSYFIRVVVFLSTWN